jgi:hypothetical protein
LINNTYTSSVNVSYQIYEAFTNVLITGANGTGTIPAGGTLPITNFEFHYFQLEAIIF